jgi:integrase
MPRRPKVPSYRHHEASGQARVTIGGRTHYLGKYGSEESKAEYRRVIRDHLSIDLSSSTAKAGKGPPDITIAELTLAYIRHAEVFYVKDGRQTNEVRTIKSAVKPLVARFATLPAREFRPRLLKLVRDDMIAEGWCRTYINMQVTRVRSMFRWGVEEEYVTADVVQALSCVKGLAKGRTAAKERKPTVPVPDHVFDATLPYLPPIVADMARVQRLCGMRPGEIVIMRAIDIDMSDPACWVYRPESHKTEHHDKHRVVFLGPRSIAVLRKYVTLDVAGYLFSPQRAEAERNRIRKENRKVKLWPSHQARRDRGNPEGRGGESYEVTSYARAVARAAKLAGVEHWHPHQLRHGFATEVGTRFGAEASRD